MKTLLPVLMLLLAIPSCSRTLSKEEMIQQAIAKRLTLTITYEYPNEDAREVIEPHVLGTTTTGNQGMQAWMLRRIPAADKKPGWRTYLLNRIRTIELSEPFEWPRPGHDPTGGKTFTKVQAAL